jgi:hypothetical protein
VGQISCKEAEENEGERHCLATVQFPFIEVVCRFAALNPHGALDFYLPGEGNISEYVGTSLFHEV